MVGVRLLLGGAGLVFLVGTLADTWNRSERLLRAPLRLGVAFALASVSVALWGRAWSVLLSRIASAASLRRGFYLSQLGKYVPGGIWQAAGLVSLARDDGVELPRGSSAFAVLVITLVTGAATVGAASAAVAVDLGSTVRMAIVASALLIALLHRRWMVAMLASTRRVARRRIDVGVLPVQHDIMSSYAWSVAASVAGAASFAVLVQPGAPGLAIAAIAAFATAWWIGFVAVPFPSGLGIREAMLLVVLHPVFGSPAIIGAAIGQRLVVIAAELVMIVGTGASRIRRRTMSEDAPLASPDMTSMPAADAGARRPLGLAPGAPEHAAGQDARKYETANPVVQRLIRRWLTRVADEVQRAVAPGDVLVDVGVGEGRALQRVAPDDIVPVGVEYRTDKVARGVERVPALRAVVGDAGVLPLRDGAARVTTCIEVLEHLTDPSVAVEELARVSRETCLVSVPWEPWFRLGNLGRGKNVRRLGNDPEHVQAFSRRRLHELLAERFVDVRVMASFPWLVAVASTPRH